MKKSKRKPSIPPRPAIKIRPRYDDPPAVERRSFAQNHPVAPRPNWAPEAAQVAMDNAIQPIYDYAGAFAYYGDDVAWLGFPYLAELTQRTEYRVITEVRAKEMTRKGFKLTHTGEDEEAAAARMADLEKACHDFRVVELLRVAAEHDGFYGGGHIYIDTGDDGREEIATPLVVAPEKIEKGGKLGFKNIEPIWCYPAAYNSSNPLGDHYFRPQNWYVMDRTVHITRLLTLISREMPDILKPSYSFRGLSLSQMVKPDVDNWLRTRQSVSDLIHSFSIVWLASNLQAQLGGGSWNSIYDRLAEFNIMRDNRGVFGIDKETEDIGNLAVPLGTLDELQAQAQEHMAASSQTPLVKLLGVTPSGLNASSDGEIRVFYDTIHALQEHLFTAPLGTILDCIQLHLWGKIDEDIGFEFVPLWQLDEAAEAAVRKTDADTHAVYIQEGVLSPEDVRGVLVSDKDSPYAGLDPDDLPDPPDMNEADVSTGGGEAKSEPAAQQRSGV